MVCLQLWFGFGSLLVLLDIFDGDLSEADLEAIPPRLHQSLTLSPIEEGEHIIFKDTKESKTWYCAHVVWHQTPPAGGHAFDWWMQHVTALRHMVKISTGGKQPMEKSKSNSRETQKNKIFNFL
jgi:hypothetical protein